MAKKLKADCLFRPLYGEELKGKSTDVTVSVSIKNEKLVDDYKVQLYINELVQLIQVHINKGN
jgi:hypothetical protein